MSRYEMLIQQYPLIDIREDGRMPKSLSGLYFDNAIRINKNLLAYEKTGVLAEEIGHHETTYGDILDLRDIRKKKLEVVARRWGYEKVLSLDILVECYEAGHRTLADVCTYLEVTGPYLKEALDSYEEKYGVSRIHGGYEITFNPFNIKKIHSL